MGSGLTISYPAKSKVPAIPLRFAPGMLRGTRDPVSLRSRDERFSTPKGEHQDPVQSRLATPPLCRRFRAKSRGYGMLRGAPETNTGVTIRCERRSARDERLDERSRLRGMNDPVSQARGMNEVHEGYLDKLRRAPEILPQYCKHKPKTHLSTRKS